eukprot:3746991-Alexandrium_andersonii.AAC.1
MHTWDVSRDLMTTSEWSCAWLPLCHFATRYDSRHGDRTRVRPSTRRESATRSAAKEGAEGEKSPPQQGKESEIE